MKSIRVLVCFLLGVLMLASGCGPGVYVRQNPGEHNRGVRFYRPKPYLFLSPATAKTIKETEDALTTTFTSPSYQYVDINLQYLPDFSEEYSISVRPGLGVANVGFKLENGWNLTEISQELDSQFDENLTAAAEVLKAGASLAGGAPAALGAIQPVRVRMTNVPLGYYESIISRGPDGRKRLYGWRYVGFAPFNACPVEAGGVEFACCNDGSLDVYGLVFEKTELDEQPVMMFKKLQTLRPDDYTQLGMTHGHNHQTAEQPSSSANTAPPVMPSPVTPPSVARR